MISSALYKFVNPRSATLDCVTTTFGYSQYDPHLLSGIGGLKLELSLFWMMFVSRGEILCKKFPPLPVPEVSIAAPKVPAIVPFQKDVNKFIGQKVNLVGGLFTPLKNMTSSIGMMRKFPIFLGKCQIDGNHSPPTRHGNYCK